MSVTSVFATLVIVAGALLAGFSRAQGAPTTQPPAYALELVADGLQLPVQVVALDDGSDRLLVVRLDGLIEVVDRGETRGEARGEVRAAPFLSLRSRVTALEGEQGLFTIALESADVAAAAGRSRLLVAAFTEKGTGDLIVAAYPADPGLERAELSREVELLRIAMPEPFHHGGQVAFGPDGMLYVSVGNGERSEEYLYADPPSAQSPHSLRGKLLRLRLPVELTQTATAQLEPEVYASGFRNPWKFSFDAESGRLLLADVGEDRWEEINDVVFGGNYGWPSREGPECLRRLDGAGLVDPDCESQAHSGPLHVYGHLRFDPDGGMAVVGGVVVRDPDLPELVGSYVFGDFVAGRVWSLDLDSGAVTLLLEAGRSVSSISLGSEFEVLITSFDGGVYRLVHAP